MITENQYQNSARIHNLEPTVIKAVAAVESGGKGFLATGEPVILFEPHVFWRELIKRKYTPSKLVQPGHSDILYEKWKTKPYGPSTVQHEKLKRAIAIDREAAICSASWGRFQIMGYHYRACGCSTIQDFTNNMYRNEDEHLSMFLNFINANGLIKLLREKKWEAFAKAYNGAGYKQNNYHIKLPNAYEALKKLMPKP